MRRLIVAVVAYQTLLYGLSPASLFHMGRYQEAVDDLSGMENPRYYNIIYSVAALAQNSQIDEANREADVLRTIRPNCTISILIGWLPFASPELSATLCAGLRKAGLAE